MTPYRYIPILTVAPGRPGLSAPELPSLAARIAAVDWQAIESSLGAHGYAETAPVLSAHECDAIRRLYDDDSRFRSRVEMARHRFGEGEYKYFAAPLPDTVQTLRARLYPPLAAIANRWQAELRAVERFPPELDSFLARCSDAGQTRPTPLLLRYEVGGYNCLHQDIYGDVAFPLQVVVALSRPGIDYTGGELLLVEQRPRAQSAGEVAVPPQGALVVFTTRARPAAGSRGYHRVNMRHGVSRVRSGMRMTMGVIFHDAR